MRRLTETIPVPEMKLRLMAILLLALIGHALFVSFTHDHHQSSTRHSLSATPIVSEDTHTPEEHLPQTNDHANCAACNLQRNLAAQLQAPVFSFALDLQPLGWESHLPYLYLHPAGFCSTGRSPPLV